MIRALLVGLLLLAGSAEAGQLPLPSDSTSPFLGGPLTIATSAPAFTANAPTAGSTLFTLFDSPSTTKFQFLAPTWEPSPEPTWISNNPGNSLANENISLNPNAYSSYILRNPINEEIGSIYHPSSNLAFCTATASGTTLTVSACSSGVIAVGSSILGAGFASGTYVTVGSGTSGTYTLNNSQTVSTPEAITADQGGLFIESSALYTDNNSTIPGFSIRLSNKVNTALVTHYVFNAAPVTATVSLQLSSTCNAVGNEFGMQLTLSGDTAICMSSTDTGAAFEVGSGPSCFHLGIGSMGADCTGGGVITLFGTNTTTSLVRFELGGVGKTDTEFTGANSGDATRALNFVDTDNSGTVPLSINMGGGKFITVGTGGIRTLGSTLTLLTGTNTLTFGSSVYDSCTALTTTSGGVLGCTASDRRLKIDGGIVSDDDALADIVAMPGLHQYGFKDGYGPGGDFIGYFAQDIQAVHPGWVRRGAPTDLTPDGTLQYDQNHPTPELAGAIKALNRKIEARGPAAQDTELRRQIDNQQTEIYVLFIWSALVTGVLGLIVRRR